jgi:hypothetical protein
MRPTSLLQRQDVCVSGSLVGFDGPQETEACDQDTEKIDSIRDLGQDRLESSKV